MNICKAILIKGPNKGKRCSKKTSKEYCKSHESHALMKDKQKIINNQCEGYILGWDRCANDKVNNKYCQEHIDEEKTGWRCCGRSCTTRQNRVGKRCQKYALNDKQCCSSKKHQRAYQTRFKFIQKVVPNFKGYEKLIFDQTHWIQLMLIRKNSFMKNIDKFVWFKILYNTLELFQIIEEGDIVDISHLDKNGNWVQNIDHMKISNIDIDGELELSECLVEFGKIYHQISYKWFYKTGYIRNGCKPISKNRAQIKIIGHIDRLEKSLIPLSLL